MRTRGPVVTDVGLSKLMFERGREYAMGPESRISAIGLYEVELSRSPHNIQTRQLIVGQHLSLSGTLIETALSEGLANLEFFDLPFQLLNRAFDHIDVLERLNAEFALGLGAPVTADPVATALKVGCAYNMIIMELELGRVADARAKLAAARSALDSVEARSPYGLWASADSFIRELTRSVGQ